MKLLASSALCVCIIALTGCASPDTSLIAANHDTSLMLSKMDSRDTQDRTLTGSRIPATSTDRLLRRVGKTEYKAMSEAGTVNPKAFN